MKSDMQFKELDPFSRLLRTRPLFTAVLFFMLGCVLANYLDCSLTVWLIPVCILSFLCILVRKNKRLLCAALVLLMLPLGAARFALSWNLNAPVDENPDIVLSGRIADDPVYREDSRRSVCLLEDVSINGEPFRGKLRLYLRGDDALLQNVRLSQNVSCSAKLWNGDEPSNHAQFNFADYLRINGIRGYATAKIEDARFTDVHYTLRDLNNRLCSDLSLRIDSLFGENAPLVQAFVLGDRSDMDEADRESFNRSGAAHLLAISGMHISVLAMLISWLLGRFLHKRNAYILTFCVLMLYGWMIGFTPSMLRAVIMFSLYHLAGLSGRYSDAPTRLAGAALIQLLISPLDILSAGFILSYSASAGIVLLSRPLSRLFHAENLLYGSIDIAPDAMLLRKLLRWIMRSVITSLAAMLATFPAVIHFFGAQPLWTLFVNLAAVPLAMLSYIVSVLGLFFGLAPVCTAGDALFGLLTGFVRFCGTLPLASVSIARFPPWLYIVCIILFFLSSDLSALPEKLRRFLPVCTLFAMLLSGCSALISLYTDEFIFMDAGQADCAILKTDGNVFLFDAGDDYTPAADYLSAMNFDVDGLFISHPHADHAAGLLEILDVCVPERIYISANYESLERDQVCDDAIRLASSMGSEIIPVKAGDVIPLSGKSFAKVLSPDAGISDHSANEDSLILHVVCGEISALLAGDMPSDAMPENLPDVDLLKVAHHGSRSAVDPRILTELSPSAAVISVGEGNSYGHPADETIELLSACGATVLRTDHCGAVTVGFEGGSLEISTFNDFGGFE